MALICQTVVREPDAIPQRIYENAEEMQESLRAMRERKKFRLSE